MKKEKTDTTESSFSLYEESITKIKNVVEQGLSQGSRKSQMFGENAFA